VLDNSLHLLLVDPVMDLKGYWVTLALIPFINPLLTLVHEAGHAVAAVALGHRVSELTVGNDQPILTVRAGSFRMRLGGLTGESDIGGFVRLDDGTRARVRDWIIIGLAGPLASLGAGIASGWAYVSLATHPDIFLFLAISGLIDAVANAYPRGDGHGRGNDGYLTRLAWRERRDPPPPPAAWVDPHEAVSTPPPGA
jgi:hypothetical protein